MGQEQTKQKRQRSADIAAQYVQSRTANERRQNSSDVNSVASSAVPLHAPQAKTAAGNKNVTGNAAVKENLKIAQAHMNAFMPRMGPATSPLQSPEPLMNITFNNNESLPPFINIPRPLNQNLSLHSEQRINASTKAEEEGDDDEDDDDDDDEEEEEEEDTDEDESVIIETVETVDGSEANSSDGFGNQGGNDGQNEGFEVISDEILKLYGLKESDLVEADRDHQKDAETAAVQDKYTPLWFLSYDDQLTRKQEVLDKVFRKLADQIASINPDLAQWINMQKMMLNGLPCEIEKIIPSPAVDGYRNFSHFTIGRNTYTNEITVGFHDPNRGRGHKGIFSVDVLKSISQPMKDACKVFQRLVVKTGREPFDPVTQEGFWRWLHLRSSLEGSLMAIIICHPQNLDQSELAAVKNDIKNFFQTGEGRAADVTSVYFQLFAKKEEGHIPPRPEHVTGEKFIFETVKGVKFRLSPKSYFPANTLSIEVICTALSEFIDDGKNTTVVDISCGMGVISLLLSKICRQVHGIDKFYKSIEDAKLMCQLNGINNCRFTSTRPENVLGTVLNEVKTTNALVVLNPLKEPLNKKVISLLRKIKSVKQVVYISWDMHDSRKNSVDLQNLIELCSPKSDSSKESPFVPVRVIPVDVLPHTLHNTVLILCQRVEQSMPPVARKQGPKRKRNRKNQIVAEDLTKKPQFRKNEQNNPATFQQQPKAAKVKAAPKSLPDLSNSTSVVEQLLQMKTQDDSGSGATGLSKKQRIALQLLAEAELEKKQTAAAATKSVNAMGSQGGPKSQKGKKAQKPAEIIPILPQTQNVPQTQGTGKGKAKTVPKEMDSTALLTQILLMKVQDNSASGTPGMTQKQLKALELLAEVEQEKKQMAAGATKSTKPPASVASQGAPKSQKGKKKKAQNQNEMAPGHPPYAASCASTDSDYQTAVSGFVPARRRDDGDGFREYDDRQSARVGAPGYAYGSNEHFDRAPHYAPRQTVAYRDRAPDDYPPAPQAYRDRAPDYPPGPQAYRDRAPEYPPRPQAYRDREPEYPPAPQAYRDRGSEYAHGPPMYRDHAPDYPPRPQAYRDRAPEYPLGQQAYRDRAPEYPPGPQAYRDQGPEYASGPPMYRNPVPEYAHEPSTFRGQNPGNAHQSRGRAPRR